MTSRGGAVPSSPARLGIATASLRIGAFIDRRRVSLVFRRFVRPPTGSATTDHPSSANATSACECRRLTELLSAVDDIIVVINALPPCRDMSLFICFIPIRRSFPPVCRACRFMFLPVDGDSSWERSPQLDACFLASVGLAPPFTADDTGGRDNRIWSSVFPASVGRAPIRSELVRLEDRMASDRPVPTSAILCFLVRDMCQDAPGPL
uniref:Uncharacterized protein n=1 Tax=Plectus sambesii TaxID=2011161 RepID=A0A914URM1_9BILA